LIEAALLFGVFAALTWMMKRRRAPGQLFAAMLGGHGLARFLAEWWRDSPLVLGQLTAGQLVSIAEFALGLGVWWLLEGRRRSAGQENSAAK
jgi:phosphatidylglycerol:prolipoprotein diacylglycerol transferase